MFVVRIFFTLKNFVLQTLCLCDGMRGISDLKDSLNVVYLRNKTSFNVFYRGNKTWVQVWVRIN